MAVQLFSGSPIIFEKMWCDVGWKEALKKLFFAGIRKSSKLKYYENINMSGGGKLIQTLLVFHRVQDPIYSSNFNFKASKLILNHGKKL